MILATLVLHAKLLPLPKKYETTSDTILQVGNLTFSCTAAGQDCLSLITTQLNLYRKAMYTKGIPTPDASQPSVSSVQITLNTTETPKTPFTANETYSITVDQSAIKIVAYDLYGCSRALSTLAQLVESDDSDLDMFYARGRYFITPCRIEDGPAYPIRKLLIDTSRHFLPFDAIKRQINGLALTRMNMLHMHIIDSQSNSYEPISEPAKNMGKAAWYTGGYFKYRNEQMKQIAEYAHEMGIHIMIEYDMPGHAASWRKADPSIVAQCPQHGYTSVNPFNELTYEYIKGYLSDLISVLYTPYNKYPLLHLGGDEVDHGCWTEDPDISKKMSEQGLTTQQVWRNFHDRVVSIVNEISSQSQRVYWQESYENGNNIDDNGVVEVWYDLSIVGPATDAGKRIVRSKGWYLDVQQPAQNQPYVFMDTWKQFYEVDIAAGVSEDKKHLVMGGGPCMWAEQINDGNIDEMIWPRTAGVAEPLWSAPQDRSITEAVMQRMVSLSCKLVSSGIASACVRPHRPCPGLDEPRD